MRRKIFLTAFVISLLLPLYGYPRPEEKKLVSPGISGMMAANLWFPKTEATLSGRSNPQVTAKAAYFVDTDTGEVLYQKNPHLKLPIASLNKIMTAIITLEDRKMNDVIEVSSHAAGMEPDRMMLIAGEKLTVEELLYGLFLVSANDAAEALAESSRGGRDEFILRMNSKAKQIGMRDSYFINPSGLEEDNKEQYSTAYDVAIMSRFAIRYFPGLLKITGTYHIVLPQTDTHQDYDLYSGINLLTTYPGVIGFKTGYTEKAGMTLVTFAQRNGRRVLGVLLNSGNRREEARELLDYSFNRLGVSI